MTPPAFDDDLCLAQSEEDFAVEQFVAQAGVEALDVAVLPRAPSVDVSGLGTDRRDPVLHSLGDELRSVVGADVSGNAPQDEGGQFTGSPSTSVWGPRLSAFYSGSFAGFLSSTRERSCAIAASISMPTS